MDGGEFPPSEHQSSHGVRKPVFAWRLLVGSNWLVLATLGFAAEAAGMDLPSSPRKKGAFFSCG